MRLPTTYSRIVGDNVRRLRKELNLTQVELCKIMRLQGYGLDSTQLSGIENRYAAQPRMVDVDKLAVFAKALDVSFETLLTEYVAPDPE